MGKLYMATNGNMPTTAAATTVATLATSSPKTLQQLSVSATAPIRVCEWGISFDGTTVLTPLKCELIATGSVGATVTTAYTATGIYKYNDPNAPASTITIGSNATATSGFNASAEGSITATRVLDVAYVSPTGFYVHQFPLGREPEVAVSNFLRVRVTDSGTAINAYTYIIWEE
jgi:hypothetical protein